VLFAREQAIFENRYDAGNQLAAELAGFKGQSAVVLAIPNGGVPIGLQVALALEVELDLVITRKIPLPLNPEAGFGAVADDGTVILNDEVVARVGLSQHQINYQVNMVRTEIRQRNLSYRQDKPPNVISDRTVILTDDGLASGFTMLATVASVRQRRAGKIVVAVPVASAAALERVEAVADRVVTLAKGTMPKFAVADFYRYWYDVGDSEVIQCLKEWRIRRFRSNVEPESKQ